MWYKIKYIENESGNQNRSDNFPATALMCPYTLEGGLPVDGSKRLNNKVYFSVDSEAIYQYNK